MDREHRVLKVDKVLREVKVPKVDKEHRVLKVLKV